MENTKAEVREKIKDRRRDGRVCGGGRAGLPCGRGEGHGQLGA